MFVWKQFRKSKGVGVFAEVKDYRMLLLFGFIPLFISING